jgi:hypothetical protein
MLVMLIFAVQVKVDGAAGDFCHCLSVSPKNPFKNFDRFKNEENRDLSF